MVGMSTSKISLVHLYLVEEWQQQKQILICKKWPFQIGWIIINAILLFSALISQHTTRTMEAEIAAVYYGMSVDRSLLYTILWFRKYSPLGLT